MRRIESDKKRFLDIVKGKARDELKKAIQKGDFIGKKDGKVVKVPLPRIDIPKIRYGGPGGGSGVGQGEGEEGDVIMDPNQQPGEGDQKAGDQAGDHLYEEYSLDDIAEILADECELPNIQPKGKKSVLSESDKLNSINMVGPPGRMHKKRTYKNALKRSIALGEYSPNNLVVPVRSDRRYRTFKKEFVPEMNALIFYLMDISGSMGEEQKIIVRNLNFLIDIWLSTQYKGLESRYIVHETKAWEVTQDDFYHLSSGGGTMISSSFKLCNDIINSDYNIDDWNIYIFYSSDGDNWGDDSDKVFELWDSDLLKKVNMIGYAQVKSIWGSGKFLEDIISHYKLGNAQSSQILYTKLEERADVLGAIKDLLGKGK